MFTQCSSQIQKAAEKMIEKDEYFRQIRTEKSMLWNSQSLEASLYNKEDGKIAPRSSDIDQGSSYNLEYMANSQMNNCVLLACLMNLAKSRPEFIMNDLIKIKNENEVEVTLYEPNEDSPKEKVKDGLINVSLANSNSKKTFIVSKEEALNWKTSHRALWPVVVEIAFAKCLKECKLKKGKEVLNNTEYINKVVNRLIEKFEEAAGEKCNDENRKELLKIFVDSISEETLKLEECSLRYAFGNGMVSAEVLNMLTGERSKAKSFIVPPGPIEIAKDEETYKMLKEFKKPNIVSVKAFQSKEYHPEILKVYNKIKQKLESKNIVIATFKNVSDAKIKKDVASIAIRILINADFAKSDTADFIECCKEGNILNQEAYEKWTSKNDLKTVKDFSISDAVKFVLEIVDFQKAYEEIKISKTKSFILNDHAYFISDVFSYEGYNYLVLEDPHQLGTKIDYTKSKKLPDGLKLPDDSKLKSNQFFIELNDFYRRLKNFSY